MAEKKRFIDVWIIEGNTVYKEVPYTVVTDWIQQGRLLADDRVRPSGTQEWFPIGGSATFAAYVPKVDVNRAEDKAEALEKVELDFAWKRREDDDDDVDMIPLIDITLVLLIFFMMTRDIAGGRPTPPPDAGQQAKPMQRAAEDIKVPQAEAKKQLLADDIKYWVGLKPGGVGEEGTIRYTWGFESRIRGGPTARPEEILQQLEKEAGKPKSPIPVRIRADKDLPFDVVKDMIRRLEATRKFDIYAEVE